MPFLLNFQRMKMPLVVIYYKIHELSRRLIVSNSNLFDNIVQNNKNKESIKKCLGAYIEQLKIHFNVSDNDINDIIRVVLRSRTSKKFWNFW